MSGYTGPITHIIVVMLENRSYDNMLGWLYNAGNQPPYDKAPAGQTGLNGLNGGEANPDPNSPGQTITVANQTADTADPNTGDSYAATTIPIFDPGEPFDDMAQQILGISSAPSTNPYAPSSTLYPPDPEHAMQGFTTNYAQLTSLSGQLTVPAANVPDVMNYFTPAQLPVTAWLANNFAVCDQWFASAPTHTFANRAFAHCAAPGVTELSGGYSLIDDPQYFLDLPLRDLPSVFSQLDAAYPDTAGGSPPNWKVYFHDYMISAVVTPYVREKAASSGNVNVATYDDSDWGSETPFSLNVTLGAVPPTFVDDLSNNKLPMYSFIEPRYSCNFAHNTNSANSNHPGGSSFYDNAPGSNSPPTDTCDGEVFLMQLYNALRGSDYWDTCLLIITYDEHGGVYDHVVPPRSTPPGGTIPDAKDLQDPASDGFSFNVFGCRVPAIVVSPYVMQGSTISPPGATPFDHTSIISTVWECFGLSDTTPAIASLTDRDAAAPSLLTLIQSKVCNDAGQYTASPPVCSARFASTPQSPAPTRRGLSQEELASIWLKRRGGSKRGGRTPEGRQ